jgi:predicted nucleic acid-binding protein
VTIVIDASVALKWVINEQGSDAAFALHGERMTAPSIWLAEAGNALWRHVRLGEITSIEAQNRFALLEQASVRTTPIEQDAAEALRIASTLNHPMYDCLYLAAAVREEAIVVTADARFASRVRESEFHDRLRLLGVN